MDSKYVKVLASALCCASSVATAQSSSSDFVTPEYLANSGLQYTRAASAYAMGFTGAGVKIGILDSPVQLNHPEFATRIYWPTPEPPFPNPGYPDFPIHGTHVTGIAAAARNGVGMMGVAFDASIANIAVLGSPGYPASSSWEQDPVSAGVSILNASLADGGRPSSASPHYEVVDFQAYYADRMAWFAEDLQRFADADIVMVFAAGNDRIEQPKASVNPASYGLVPLIKPEISALGYTDDPADAVYRLYDNYADLENPTTWPDHQIPLEQAQAIDYSHLAGSLIAVVNIDIDVNTGMGRLYADSNECGLAADWCITAPGTNIFSTLPVNSYGLLTGTSMSAPFVSGGAALVRQAFPYMTARQVIEVLLTTATDLGDPLIYGHGLLNLERAVKGPTEFGSASLIPGNKSIFAPTFAVDTKGYDSVWSNAISGTGGFSKAGAGMLTLTGANTYTGDTTITGGVLRVDGSIASSDLTVASAATLQGTGTVGNTLLAGILSPGNSVGTLTVDGNLNLQDGATYLYEIDAEQNSDLVVVSGTATIADGVVFELAAEDGVYLDQLYPMIQAGTLNGTFENLHTNYTFIDLDFMVSTTVSGNELGMVAERNQTPMASFAQTNNQRAVANAIDAQSGVAEPYNDVILNDDPSQLPGWYQDWSGEIYSANQAALIYNSRLVAQVVNWRLQDSWLPGQSNRLQQVGQSHPKTGDTTTVWAQAYGNWDSFSANADAQKATASSGGFILGVDHKLSPNVRLGAGFVVSNTSTSVAASRANTQGHGLMAYASYNTKAFRLNGGLVQSWQVADVNRTLPLDDAGNARGTVASRSTQLFADLSSPITLNKQQDHQTTLSPFGQISQVWLNTSNFGETGAEAGLSGQANNASVGFGTMGARLTHQWQTKETAWQASLSAGWQRAWGDLAPTTTLAFATGPDFTVSAAPIARDAAVIELGIGASLGPSSRLNVVYSTTLASQSSSQMLQAQLQWWF